MKVATSAVTFRGVHIVLRRWVFAFMAAIVLSGCDEEEQASKAPPTIAARPEVGIVVLHPQSVAITAELPGRTAASLIAEVRPQVSGIIQKRLFREGTEVKAEEPLYQIDPASYQASYDSALAALEKASAAVPSTQSKVERYRDLIKTNAVSKQDLDDAVATSAQAKAEVASARASVETARINLDYTTIRAPIEGRVDQSSLTPGALVTASQETVLTTVRRLDLSMSMSRNPAPTCSICAKRSARVGSS